MGLVLIFKLRFIFLRGFRGTLFGGICFLYESIARLVLLLLWRAGPRARTRSRTAFSSTLFSWAFAAGFGAIFWAIPRAGSSLSITWPTSGSSSATRGWWLLLRWRFAFGFFVLWRRWGWVFVLISQICFHQLLQSCHLLRIRLQLLEFFRFFFFQITKRILLWLVVDIYFSILSALLMTKKKSCSNATNCRV